MHLSTARRMMAVGPLWATALNFYLNTKKTKKKLLDFSDAGIIEFRESNMHCSRIPIFVINRN
jgi:hypothetical protein